jgi:Immune inhibitor A-like, MAM domain
MASSGKVSSAHVIGTLVIVLFLTTTGTVIAGDGPSVEGRSASIIEAHEILPPGALAASPTIKTTTTSTLLTDGFEGTFPGATWQLYHDAAGADVDWGTSPYEVSAGYYSIWCAGSGSDAPPDSGADVPVNTYSWAIAGPFDLSGASSGELQFDLWLETELNYDYFKWLASTDGSSFSGLQTSTSTSGFQTVTVDLSDWGSAGNLLGQSQVWIAFIYQSDESNTYEGAYVDQVSLTTDGGGGGSNCGTYVLTDDNDNNSWAGTPDGDWGYCLYNNDAKHPIEFHFNVNESSISSAQLLLLCNDVDQHTLPNNPEVDKVYVNNTYIGDLTGANGEDSTTIFTVPVNSLSPGTNRVRIDVNQGSASVPTDWCVEIKQAQLIINGGCTGQATCRSVSTNAGSYAPGATVDVTYEIDTAATSQQIRVESNLLNPDGVIVAGAERNYTTNGSANDPKTVSLALPSTAAAGTYKAQVLVFDSASGQLESTCEASFVVGGGGGSCDITCTATVPTTAQVGQTVNFTSTASGSGDCGTIEYFWTPEQGYSTATIFGRNGTWVYNTAGTYTWTYSAIGDNGGRCDRTGTIVVTGGGGGCSLTCNASVPATAQAGQLVNLNGSATATGCNGTIEYFWFPDNDNSTATIFDRNATWIYENPGTYNWLFSAAVDNETCRRNGSINITGGGGVSDVIWVPVVSHANGANNSTWVSDLGILNPGTVATTVIIKIYVSTGPIIKTVNINAGGQIVITDVVGWFRPGLITSAPISITSSQTLIITSRTYNLLAAGVICFPTGTLGQGLSGYLTTGGISAGQAGWIPNMLEYNGFRSNIGYTNTGSTNASLTVRLFNGNGVKVGSYNATLAPGQWKQANQPFKINAGLSNMRAGSASVTVTSGSGVVVYGSVIDNITNDPTTIPFYR